MSRIILKDIERIYSKDTEVQVVALQNINVEINNGDLVAIVGKSGSGKSTLLNIIGTLDKPTKGTYILGDEDITKTKKTLHKIRNKKIGFILQDFGLINNKTAQENVEIPLLFNDNISLKNVKIKAVDMLEQINIGYLKDKLVKNLSGGEKQRVAIARALVNEPDIILADEPTGSLDSITSSDIMKMLLEINKIGKTVIIVTHDLEIANMCSKIVEIKDGRIEHVHEKTKHSSNYK